MVKQVVLTAIKYKGIEQVKKEASEIAANCFTTVGYIRSIIQKVEKGYIQIN